MVFVLAHLPIGSQAMRSRSDADKKICCKHGTRSWQRRRRRWRHADPLETVIVERRRRREMRGKPKSEKGIRRLIGRKTKRRLRIVLHEKARMPV